MAESAGRQEWQCKAQRVHNGARSNITYHHQSRLRALLHLQHVRWTSALQLSVDSLFGCPVPWVWLTQSLVSACRGTATATALPFPRRPSNDGSPPPLSLSPHPSPPPLSTLSVPA